MMPLTPLTPNCDAIPALCKQHNRWMRWTLDGAGKKVPRSVLGRSDKNVNGTKPEHWGSFDQLRAANEPLHGPAFALGAVDGGPTFSGIDIDDCRDPNTGIIEPWAWTIIRQINSYTEVSPSGTGVKIFVTGTLPDGSKQGKVYRLEIYDRGRYFTVTGHHIAGTPKDVVARETELRALHARQQSGDLIELVKLFALYKQDRGEYVDIECPWADEHSGPDSRTDVGLRRGKDGRIDGFHCFHASHADTKKLGDVLKLFGLKGGHTGFICSENGKIIADNQENIRRALEKLGITLSHDVFAEKMLATQGGHTRPFEDPLLERAWLLVDEEFRFRGSFQFFKTVLSDTARRAPFHPVRDYLSRVTWDGTKRIDTWLATYANAPDSEYHRAISAIVLIAAVRRIQQPGCKYDEMVVLESEQGLDKSSALRTLCGNDDWFSDDLALNLDAKRIIEATLGKWIIEASDLSGKRKADHEHLKSMLSRQVDGPARMAYAHLPVSRPRHFIIIGTTNSAAYLNDSTGARRFWPVKVQRFNIGALARDRDQLWAEAKAREAAGESIRLPQRLWGAAGEEQEMRREVDPWEEELAAAVETVDRMDSSGRRTVVTEDLWGVLEIDKSRRDRMGSNRISEIMQRLGFSNTTRSIDGQTKRVYVENQPRKLPLGEQ